MHVLVLAGTFVTLPPPPALQTQSTNAPLSFATPCIPLQISVHSLHLCSPPSSPLTGKLENTSGAPLVCQPFTVENGVVDEPLEILPGVHAQVNCNKLFYVVGNAGVGEKILAR